MVQGKVALFVTPSEASQDYRVDLVFHSLYNLVWTSGVVIMGGIFKLVVPVRGCDGMAVTKGKRNLFLVSVPFSEDVCARGCELYPMYIFFRGRHSLYVRVFFGSRNGMQFLGME